MDTPIRVQPRKHTLPYWLAEKHSRQTVIGIEWDCSVRQRRDFANVKARIWQNRRSERDFWLPLLFLFRYPDEVGNRWELKLDIARKKIMKKTDFKDWTETGRKSVCKNSSSSFQLLEIRKRVKAMKRRTESLIFLFCFVFVLFCPESCSEKIEKNKVQKLWLEMASWDE